MKCVPWALAKVSRIMHIEKCDDHYGHIKQIAIKLSSLSWASTVGRSEWACINASVQWMPLFLCYFPLRRYLSLTPYFVMPHLWQLFLCYFYQLVLLLKQHQYQNISSVHRRMSEVIGIQILHRPRRNRNKNCAHRDNLEFLLKKIIYISRSLENRNKTIDNTNANNLLDIRIELFIQFNLSAKALWVTWPYMTGTGAVVTLRKLECPRRNRYETHKIKKSCFGLVFHLLRLIHFGCQMEYQIHI